MADITGTTKDDILAGTGKDDVIKGLAGNDILAGACNALSKRIVQLIDRLGVTPAFTISGGVAKNIGVVKRLEEQLDLRARIASEPQIVGALGAALYAKERLNSA